jgi:esterase/lipase superfamily enzyme
MTQAKFSIIKLIVAFNLLSLTLPNTDAVAQALGATPQVAEKCPEYKNSIIAANDYETQRQLIVLGLLNGEIGKINQTEGNRSICNFRRIFNIKVTEKKIDAGEKKLMANAEIEFTEWANFKTKPATISTNGSLITSQILVPENLTPLYVEQSKNDYDPHFRSLDGNIEIRVYLFGPGRHSISTFLNHLLINKSTMKFTFVSIEKERFVIEGENQTSNGTKFKFYQKAFLSGGIIKGVYVKYPSLAPLKTNAPPPNSILEALNKYNQLDLETQKWQPNPSLDQKSREWQASMLAVTNIISSQFEKDNGASEINTKDCEKNIGKPEVSNFVRKRVIFGTDRKRVSDGENQFAASPIRDHDSLFDATPHGGLHIGCAVVSIPSTIDDNRFLKTRSISENVTVDRAKFFYIDKVAVLSTSGTETPETIKMNDEGNTDGSNALVMIHGFNVSFSESLFRAAQIAHVSNYKGRIYVYSWPSKHRKLDYLSDLDNSEQAEVYFRQFLRTIMTDSTVRKIDFIAHSMGSQTLLRTLSELRDEFVATAQGEGYASGERRRRLGQVIFASPDVGAFVFSGKIKELQRYATRITLYTSTTDRAMYLSKSLRGGVPRAGDPSALDLISSTNIQIIDASNESSDDWKRFLTFNSKKLAISRDQMLSFGHTDFALRKSMITDVGNVLNESGGRTATPMERQKGWFRRFPEQLDQKAKYWKLIED